MSRDYIPTTTPLFMAFQEGLNAQVTTNGAGWNIPAAEITALNTWNAGYNPLYVTVSNRNTRTREEVVAHDQYKADYVAFLRSFCQAFLTNNLLIPISERVALGLNPRGLNPPSKRPIITTSPIPNMRPMGGGMVQFGFKVEGSNSTRGRHPDSNGVEVYFKLEPQSTGPKVLNDVLIEDIDPSSDGTAGSFEKTFSTRASFINEMGLDSVGMKLTIYARWVNTSDPTKNGPYSSAISMVVS